MSLYLKEFDQKMSLKKPKVTSFLKRCLGTSLGLSVPILFLSTAAQAQVTVYEHCEFKGKSVTLPVGSIDYNNMIQRGIKNDDVSSIKVESGYEVTLYQHDKFAGTSHRFTKNDNCLVDNKFNDETSSIVIKSTTAPTGNGFIKIANTAISGKNDASFSNVSEQECQTKCASHTDFVCKSVDYTKSTRKCDLSKSTLSDSDVKKVTSSAYSHYQRTDLTPTSGGNNTATFKLFANTAIAGQNDASFSNVSEQECQSKCASHTDFVCKSVDYTKSSRKCDLSKSTLSDSAVKKVSNTAYNHYQRTDLVQNLDVFKLVSNTAIKGENHKTYKNVSIDQCKAHCLNSTSLTCRSFDYTKSTKTCDLSESYYAQGGVDLISNNNNYSHYVRKDLRNNVLRLNKLHAVQTTDSGEDEVYYKVFIDRKGSAGGSADYKSSIRDMNEDDSRLENWNINKNFGFKNTIEVYFMEEDSSNDDLIGVLKLGSSSRKGTFYKIDLNSDADGYYQIDYNLLAEFGDSGRQSIEINKEYQDVWRPSAFKEKVGSYSCKIDPWTTRANIDPKTESACSVPDGDADFLTDDDDVKKFSPACQTHDLCYSAPWRLAGKYDEGKEFCDDAFGRDMKAICINDPNRLDCEIWEDIFEAGVKQSLFSDEPQESYDEGQDWADDHCEIQ